MEHEEEQYLAIIKECIESGIEEKDRTGTGTRSVFGRCMRYSLRDGTFPLLTTKRVAFKAVLEELLFFINGQTDNKILKTKGVHIWDGNSTKEFLNKQGIDREEDDLGPIYGFQWRHFSAPYKTCEDDYSNKGVDQLSSVIQELKKNPSGRRHVVVSWNPTQLPEMALPPCHCLFQFRIYGGKLSCSMYQRSGDMGLGIPFNIASYSLLTIMIAKLVGCVPDEFVHFIADTHVYLDHIEPLKEQLTRKPRPFPKLWLRDKKYEKIEDFVLEDFILENYNPHPRIVMKMSV